MYHQRFKTEDERFSEKYAIEPNGCWIWKAKTDYPRFWVGDGYEKASRYIWQKTNGVRLAADQCVCHRCDNPRCVNPDHMFIGSHLENMQDKAQKGRASRCPGSRNGRAKLSDGEAVEARLMYQAGLSQQKIADRFGVSQQTVSSLVRGESWAAQ